MLRYLTHAEIVLPVTMQFILFGDEDQISEYAKNAVQTMTKLGMLEAGEGNAINPKGEASRADAAAMFYAMADRIAPAQ